MPQMSPCNWMFMFLFINLMITLIKLNIFFEKK
uniref:ATP synthase F0 subunit 8 n=1 Tax=Peregrinus maidis TaxID=222432 RepID=A0A343UJC9_9HEMI|nr:ATP synthase F0 subunit 8 [Peregrinus maidis]AVC55507.1 ATP synthase F0 subunit 8 [Peregrinus maidis]